MTDSDMLDFDASIGSSRSNAGRTGGNKTGPNSEEVYSLLHYASSCGDVEIFLHVLSQCKQLDKLLLTQSQNNLTNETPLHFAVSSNNLEIVNCLLDKIREIRTLSIQARFQINN